MKKSPPRITATVLLQHMQAMEQRLTGNTRELEKLAGSIQGMEKKLTENMQEMKLELLQDIQGAERRLGARIDHVEGTLQTRMDRLENKVDRLEHKVNTITIGVDNIDKRLDDIEVVQVPKLKKAVGMR